MGRRATDDRIELYQLGGHGARGHYRTGADGDAGHQDRADSHERLVADMDRRCHSSPHVMRGDDDTGRDRNAVLDRDQLWSLFIKQTIAADVAVADSHNPSAPPFTS